MSGSITLSAGMRANLLSLQNTAHLQATTQGRLATSKKVNSALDNPSSFFAAQSLTDRANDLSNLLDGMGQAIQTITTATQGITAAESIVSQMTAVATTASQSLGSSNSSNSTSKEAVTVSATVATSLTALSGSSDFRTLVDTNKNSLGIANGDILTVKVDTGATYTFTVGASNVNNTAVQSNGGGTTVADLSVWLKNVDGSASGLTLSVATGVLSIASSDTVHTLTVGGNLGTELGIAQTALTSATSTVAGTVTVASGSYVITQLAGTSTMLSEITTSTGLILGNGTGSGSDGNYGLAGSLLTINNSTITIAANMTVQDLMSQINNISGLSTSYNPIGGIKISNTSGAAITISGTAAAILGGVQTIADKAASVTTVSLYQGLRAGGATGLSSLATYTAQYDTLRSQLNQLVQDASYQGINLIAGSGANPLTVQFNNASTNQNKLTVQAVDLTTTGLGIGAAAANWSDVNSIQGSLSGLTNANSTLRTQASTFGQNLTTVQTRQDFTTNLINTLQTGAGNLTNADMNTESANMLALQTQQQLGISSLSLASQAAQGILKLFP